MILFFKSSGNSIIAAGAVKKPDEADIEKLAWLFGKATLVNEDKLSGDYIGPRKEMITPWSTNAVEITQNMGIRGITRIEELFPVTSEKPVFDPMLQALYSNPDQHIFTIDRQPDPVIFIDDIAGYNEKEGLALSAEEVKYLDDLSVSLGRKLTDSEVFGFSQVNSEHCRHKIFNGTFIIDGKCI